MTKSKKQQSKQQVGAGGGLAAVVVIFVFLSLAVVIGLLVFKTKNKAAEGRLIAAWRDADQAYLQTNFSTAESAYEALARLIQEGEDGKAALQADLDLAQAAKAVCAAAQVVEQALARGKAPVLSDLDATVQRLAALPPATTSVGEHAAAGGKAGRELEPAARVQALHGWAILKIQLAQDAAEASGPAAKNASERAAALIEFVGRHGGPVAALQERQSALERKIVLSAAREEFTSAVAGAVAQVDEKSFLDVKSKWQSLREQFPEEKSWDDQWRKFCQDLRKGLAGRVVVAAGDAAASDLARLDKGPEQLPVQSACALSGGSLPSAASDAPGLVFALFGDRCCALDAATGEPRWVVRTGYDVTGLPQAAPIDGGAAVIVAWQDIDGRQLASALSAVDGANLWTVQLPSEMRLAGPPLLHARGLFLLLQSGELWQIDLRTGSLVARLRFPESAAGSLVMREDARGALLFGKQMACYGLEFASPVGVKDVIELAPEGDTLDTWGFWIPPLVVFVQNRFTGQSVLRVLLQQSGGGYRQVQRFELAGRLWQAPVVRGSRFLLATDDGHEAIFGVNLNTPNTPLYEMARQKGPPRDSPHRPLFSSFSDESFCVQQGHIVERLLADPLEIKGLQRKTMWRCELEAGTVPTQPLQHRGPLVVAAGQLPGREGIRLTAIGEADGKPVWTRDLGAAAREMLVNARDKAAPPRVIVRTSLGGLFSLDVVDSNQWTTQPLSIAGVNESLVWAPKSDLLAWVKNVGDPELCVATLGGETKLAMSLDKPAASPLAVWEGGLNAARANGAADAKREAWLTFIDARGRVGLMNAASGASRPQFTQLPPEAPLGGWHRPQWIGGHEVLFSHPDGWIIVATVRKSGEVFYLAVSEAQQRLPYGLVGRPAWKKDALWLVADDGALRALSLPALAPVGEAPLAAAASTGPIGESEVLVGLRDGSVAIFGGDGVPTHLRTVAASDRPIVMLSNLPSSGAVAVDSSGRVFRVGATATQIGACSAVTPPLCWRDTLFFATASGSIETMPLVDSLSARAP